jgi:predicted phosphoribosyltransferase
MVRFHDRRDAGRRLAELLEEEAGPDVLVLGLARGGVPVAYEVARKLHASLDVLVVRKLGAPGREELGIGAVAPLDTRVLNDHVVRLLRIPDTMVEQITTRERAELERRERSYRRGATAQPIAGREVVVIDDGLATGATMRAAVASLTRAGARKVTVAVPAGSEETCEQLGRMADVVVCPAVTEPFFALGQLYDDFSPTTDDEVRDLLARASARRRVNHARPQ